MPWPDLSWQNSVITPAQFTLSVVGLIFGLLVFGQVTPDVILIGAVVLLLLTGILTPGEALAGMSNEGMLTVRRCAKRAASTTSPTCCWDGPSHLPAPWPA